MENARTQSPLRDLFEQQFTEQIGTRDVGADLRVRPSEPNPFRKQWGACANNGAHNGEADQRVYWCHVCQKKFCWECLNSHKD